MVAGAARILVTFQIDADGLLNVSAREEITGAQSSVTVKPSFGLSDDEIAGMLQASFSHAGQDKLARQLAEQRLAARQLAEGLEAALAADGDTLLDAHECAALRAQMAELQALMETDDVDAMRRLTEQLGRGSEAFAARRMDKSIRQALAGVSLDSLDEEVEE
jgi:molecular chaperone HscA